MEIDLSTVRSDRLYPAETVASLLNLTEKTLANFRAAGRGPAFHRIRRKPFYSGSDLLSYIESCRVSCEPGARPNAQKKEL